MMSTLPPSNTSLTNNTEKTVTTLQTHATKTVVMVSPFVFLVAFIIIGNTLVMASFKANIRLRTRTNAFLVSLAVSDFLVGSVSLPMWIFCTVSNWNVSATFNAVFKSLDVFGALASIFHLTAISIERYIAVSKPFYYNSLQPAFHRTLITTAWSAAGFMASASLLTIPFSLDVTWMKFFSMALFLCGFVAPSIIIAWMYVGIFRAARALFQRSPDPGTFKPTRNLSKYHQGEWRVAITVAVITCLFISAWVPFFVVSIMAAYCMKCLPPSPDSLYKLIVIVKWVHYANSAINPLVYARRDAEMRKTFLRLLGIPRGVFCFRTDDVTPWGFPMRSRAERVNEN